MDAYINMWKNYFDFNSRVSRKDYWCARAIDFLALMAIVLFGKALNLGENLSAIYALASIIPVISLSVRRLHDTNRSGWWYLIALVPVIGWLILFVFMIMKGDDGTNRFDGEAPKAV
ncbi:DUF805 domain-containing protein [Pseudomonas luteola]